MPLSEIGHGIVFPTEPDGPRQSCAFPQVAALADGRWIVGCRSAPAKGENRGQHVRLRLSSDEGRSWREADAPFVPRAIGGCVGQFRAVALTALGGSRVLAALYWVDYSHPDRPFFNEQTEGLLDSRILLAESTDGGLSWSEPRLVDTSPFNVPTPITGPVLRLPGGEWVCQFETNKPYFDTSKWVHSSVLLFSRDEGRTWPRHSVVTRDPRVFYWDQRPQALPDGRLFDVFWTYDTAAASYRNIHACESVDAGRTWSALRDTGVPGQPAPVVALRDGRLLLVYVDRTGAPAIRCRLSTDGGRSWPVHTAASVYESDLPGQTVAKEGMADAWSEMGKFSVGLPATALLPDGTVLVVFYAGASTDRTSVRWTRLRAD